MSNGRKNVLVITYYFPPSGGAGVQRPLKFVKYLREKGWEPIVLTAKDADYQVYDESFIKEIPENLKIYRSKILEPYRLYRKFTGRNIDDSVDIATNTLYKQKKQKLSELFSEFVRASFFIPDARIGWLLLAYALGKKILNHEKIDVIFSTAPPYTTQLIGLALHKSSKIPWVADFRDSWIGWHSTPRWRPKLARRLEIWMEGSVLKYANRLISVSSGVKKDLIQRHPEVKNGNWEIIPNGYDAEDFKDILPAPKNRKLTITYTGTFFGEKSPEYLLQALEQINQENATLLEDIQIRFVGRIAELIMQRINLSSVRNLIEIVPYISHKKSLAYLKSSDVTLLIIDDTPINQGILTGKLFEYIGAGKPILALVPQGDAAELIQKNQLGIVVPSRDVNKIRQTLVHLIENHKQGKNIIQPSQEVLHRFERKTLTGELANIFNELTYNKE